MTTETSSLASSNAKAKSRTLAKQKLRPDWWSKTFAGGVLGLSLALALSGLFAWVGPGGITAPNKVQFNMWIIAPLWTLIFSFSYLFTTGRRALLWLLLANLLAYGLLFWVRGLLFTS